MKLVVFGNTGQLGAALVEQAAARGIDVAGFGSADVEITDPAAVERALETSRPAVVVNATAAHVVPECEQQPERAFAVNAAAVKRLAEACEKRGLGLVTYSTDYVFDGAKGTPYAEDDAPRPLQTYGVSKLAGEQLCALFHPGALVVRTCGVYGGSSGSRAKKGNFLLNLLRDTQDRAELEVSSEQIVNPTYAVDLARASLDLVARGAPGGVYHLASEGHCSWAEFAAAAMEVTGRSTRIVPVDRGGHSGAARRPRFSALANRRAASLGVVLPTWRDGLARYLETLAVRRA